MEMMDTQEKVTLELSEMGQANGPSLKIEKSFSWVRLAFGL